MKLNYECPWVEFRGEESTVKVLLYKARWFKRDLYTAEILGPHAAVKAVLAALVQRKDVSFGLKACEWCTEEEARHCGHGYWTGRKGSFRIVGLSGFLAHGVYVAREAQLRHWEEGKPFVVCGASAEEFLKTAQARYAIPCPDECAEFVLKHAKEQRKPDSRQPWITVRNAIELQSLNGGGWLVSAAESDFDQAVSLAAREGEIKWD